MDINELSGVILTKESNEYKEMRSGFNKSIIVEDCIINICFNDDDVINAIKFVQKHNLSFRVRNGRHDFEGNSYSQCQVIIDISNINYIDVDYKHGTARLGGGILSGKMYHELAKKDFTIPSGTCADVGFCGLATVGGVGYASRIFGLSCDNLKEVELINFKGDKIIANEKHNSDLLWALKGGLAANFGIITAFTFKISPVSKASVFRIDWHVKDAKKVIYYWQEFAPYAHKALSSNLGFRKLNGETIFCCEGQFLGDIINLNALLEELLKVATPISVEMKYLTYDEVINRWANNCGGASHFKSSGSFIYNKLTLKEIDHLCDCIINAPKGVSQFYEFISLGGAIQDFDYDKSAFVHRDALFLIQLKSIWDCEEDKQKNIDWINNTKMYLDTIGKGTYRGFTDFNIKNWQEQYYGDNYKKLQEVKLKYDPNNFFNFPHSIEGKS